MSYIYSLPLNTITTINITDTKALKCLNMSVHCIVNAETHSFLNTWQLKWHFISTTSPQQGEIQWQ